jgi:hypothetical protein
METGTIGTVNGDMYIADGDYIRDIEVNDLRNRYTLTKGSTQKMVNTPLVSYPLISPVPSDLIIFLPPGEFHTPLLPCVGPVKLT